jgi:hypothetical protein
VRYDSRTSHNMRFYAHFSQSRLHKRARFVLLKRQLRIAMQAATKVQKRALERCCGGECWVHGVVYDVVRVVEA